MLCSRNLAVRSKITMRQILDMAENKNQTKPPHDHTFNSLVLELHQLLELADLDLEDLDGLLDVWAQAEHHLRLLRLLDHVMLLLLWRRRLLLRTDRYFVGRRCWRARRRSRRRGSNGRRGWPALSVGRGGHSWGAAERRHRHRRHRRRFFVVHLVVHSLRKEPGRIPASFNKTKQNKIK